MKGMKDLALDNRRSSILEDYSKQICANVITEYMKRNELSEFVVSRPSEYGTTSVDTYVLDGDILKRNGTNVRWCLLGKLYQAYKEIK